MDTSDLVSSEPAENEPHPPVNTKWKVVAVSNANNESLKPVAVLDQGNLAHITSNLSDFDKIEGGDGTRSAVLERPKTAFYVPDEKAADKVAIDATPNHLCAVRQSLPPPLPKRRETVGHISTGKSFLKTGYSAKHNEEIISYHAQPRVAPVKETSISKPALNFAKGKSLRKPPSLAKLEARKATQDDLKADFLGKSTLSIRAGNTINQYWKS